MRRMAFSFSMTPLMNSPSARRSVKQREMTLKLCEAGLMLVWLPIGVTRGSSTFISWKLAWHKHDWGFVARWLYGSLVIKPNSWLWNVISAVGYGNICWGSRELTLLSLTNMWREHRGPPCTEEEGLKVVVCMRLCVCVRAFHFPHRCLSFRRRTTACWLSSQECSHPRGACSALPSGSA